MTEIVLQQSHEDAKELVKEAFENTRGISEYHDGGRQIVAKTGVSFPRVLWSYGESIYVDFSESTNANQTRIDVWAEKEVSINIGANPERYKRRFLRELDSLREQDETEWGNVNRKQQTASETNSGNQPVDIPPSSQATTTTDTDGGSSRTKEVKSDYQLSSGSSTAILYAILAMIFMLFLFMAMLP